MEVVGLLALFLVVLLVVRRRRKRGRIADGSEALAQAFQWRVPYSGPAWKVGKRWL